MSPAVKLQSKHGLEALSSLCRNAGSCCLLSHYLFPITENNANIFNGSIFWHRKWYWEKKKSYAHNAFIWLLWNHQNRKSCILHKPANYFILITVIFTPWSLLTNQSRSVTIWELTHYSKLSLECFFLYQVYLLWEHCIRWWNQVCGSWPCLFVNEFTAQMVVTKLWAASRAWLWCFSDLNCFALGYGDSGVRWWQARTQFSC